MMLCGDDLREPTASSGEAGPSRMRIADHANRAIVGRTPINLVNNGVHVTGAAGSPSIFSSSPVQVLRLPTQSSRFPGAGASQFQDAALKRVCGAPAPTTELTAHEKLFGAKCSLLSSETTTGELARHEIVTVSQLQRALRNKIMQATRSPAGLWRAFHKLDQRGTQHLNLSDLIAAVDSFNLVAHHELVKQLLHALDSDHDGELSLSDFVAGLQANQLQSEPSYQPSSRQHFRRHLKFNHPLHNMAHMSAFHSFEDKPPY